MFNSNILDKTYYKLYVRFHKTLPSMLERMDFIVIKKDLSTLSQYLPVQRNVKEINRTCSNSQCRN